LLVLVGEGAIGAQAADESAEFAAAEAAFRAGDFASALDLFKAARAAGSAGPAIDYNSGVCEYKLGDYAAAAATFATLAEQFPSMRELAQYNRGLALLALGRDVEATAAFEIARTSSDPAIARLSAEKLGTSGPAAPRAWTGFASLAVGHDDDVALLDELSLPAGVSAASAFSELVGGLSRTLGYSLPLRLDASAYVVRYPDARDYDQDAVRLGFSVLGTRGAWRFEGGPYYDYDRLGGSAFERLVGAGGRARRSFGDRTRVDLRVAVEDVSSADERYDYIEGTRRQLRATVEHDVGLARWRFGYGLETNSRADPSVSPRRNRWALEYLRSIDAWSLGGSLLYRESRYSDAAPSRSEDLKEIAMTVRRTLHRDYLIELTLRHSANDSTDARFSYRTNRVGIGVAKSF
jgi:tetratricopeptide (TPR) repeat protein